MPVLPQLRADHDAFRALGRDIETILRSPRPAAHHARLIALVRDFKDKLSSHAEREDGVLYPAVRAVMHRSAILNDAYMNHLDHEHRSIDGYVERLLQEVSGPTLSLGWGQTFALFSVGLRSHMRREEEELFPEAERLLGDNA